MITEEDFKPNSHKYKEEQSLAKTDKPKIEKVIEGTVKTKKKSEGSKLKDIFISDDASSVASNLFMDILVPAIKNTLSDIVTNGINMILFGGDARNRNKRQSDYVSYNRFSSRDNRDYNGYNARNAYALDDIYLNTRGDAEEVLDQMQDIINQYGIVRVADLYDMLGITGRYTDNRYGWSSVRRAKILSTRDGFKLELPKAMPID